MVNLSVYFEQMTGFLPELSKIKVTSFVEGFSNHVYRLDWDNNPQIVVRVASLDAASFGIDRSSEIQAMALAAEAAISPKLLWYDEAGSFACEFVHGATFGWDVMHTRQNILRIAKVLKRTHQLPEIQHSFCIYEVIQRYLERIEGYLDERPELIEEHLYLSDIFAQLERVKPSHSAVLCHNDLNPKNLLMAESACWLIDWEYSGMGDPLFDLAVVARSHNLNDDQRVQFIQAYQPSLDISDTMWRLNVYGRAYSLREMAWLLLKHLTTPNDPDALGYYYEFKAMPSLNAFL